MMKDNFIGPGLNQNKQIETMTAVIRDDMFDKI